jgi:molecular chaperone DnaK
VDEKPLAIRIARPQTSEEAFLEEELDTMSRSTVMLLGATARPAGTILRFEITLQTGTPVLRGEGRVVEHRIDLFRGLQGLMLKFTKLDARSKALIDRAHDARKKLLEAPVSEAPKRASGAPEAGGRRDSEAPTSKREMPSAAEAASEEPETRKLHTVPPAGRSAMLDRLRNRGQALSAERVGALLEEGRTLRSGLKA